MILYIENSKDTTKSRFGVGFRESHAQGASRVAPGKSGPHEMARGSSSLLSSHGRVIGPQDVWGLGWGAL